MKKTCLTLMLAVLSMAAQPATITGVITDTMCGAKHAMMKNQPDAECVRMCTKGQASYALFDGTNVLKLSDQKTPARYAAQKVKVTGALDPKTNTIKVSSIEPAGGK